MLRRVRVAIESNPQFDATRLVASSITVAGARTGNAHRDDLNGDGRDDLIVKVRQSSLARRLPSGARARPPSKGGRGAVTGSTTPTG